MVQKRPTSWAEVYQLDGRKCTNYIVYIEYTEITYMQNRPIIKTLNTVEDIQSAFGDGLPPEEVKRLAEKKERRNRKKYPFIPSTGFIKKYQPYTKKKKTYFFAEEVR